MTDDPRFLVPATPGPIVELGAGRQPDELDAIVEELFGADDDRGPGPFDAGLLLAGGALVLWGIGSGPSGALVAGAIAVALGTVLPFRWLWRRTATTQRSRRVARASRSGHLLRGDHPLVVDLLAAHRQLLTVDPPAEALDAGHLAVVEVATLLDGRVPTAPAEEDYVGERLAALTRLVEHTERQRAADEHEDRRVQVEARAEVEHLARGGSLQQIADLLDQ